MLLVHGWDGTARYWDLVAPALSDRYHLVAVTLRGRGRSGVDPTGRYRFDDHVSDLDEVTQRLGLERFAFVGASLGGMLALPYAARHPRRVERDSGLQSLPVPGAPAGVRRAAPRVPPVARVVLGRGGPHPRCSPARQVTPAAAAPEPAPAPPGA